MGTIKDCIIIKLNVIHRSAGDLAVVEGGKDAPFPFKRIYYLFNVPDGVVRGGHAHKHLYQLLIAINGSFTVVVDDGFEQQEVKLFKQNEGLLIVPGIWRELKDFSGGAVALVIASEGYDAEDYIRDYAQFIRFRNGDSVNS